METMSMVVVSKMTQLMKKHIILQDLRQTYDIQIQVDITLCRTASPIRSIVLYSHIIIQEVITYRQFEQTWR